MNYCIYAASIESSGVCLSSEPYAAASTLRAALAHAADYSHHGPEGAAIVFPDGRMIYTAAEYDAAREEVADDAACEGDYAHDRARDDEALDREALW